MQVVEISLHNLREAPWNPNQMDEAMLARLVRSIKRYGVVENLVVRPLPDRDYEVLNGNQRLKVLSDLDIEMVPCVVMELGDAHARLLAQALNSIEGQDDLGLRAELLRQVLDVVPESEVLSILPETAVGLKSLVCLGPETVTGYLRNWQDAQAARLKHLQFQLTAVQYEVVEKVMARVQPQAKQAQGDSPNVRGTALYLLCKRYLEAGD
ncbi:ParB/RepB/Spo0J family partition protein [Chloroflexota bacterium]